MYLGRVQKLYPEVDVTGLELPRRPKLGMTLLFFFFAVISGGLALCHLHPYVYGVHANFDLFFLY